MNETWWVSKDQLIPEQVAVIDLPLGKSYLILGPPGSGKTNLLLLRANYEYLAGHRDISVVVFTKALQTFLSAGASQYDFPAKKILTSTKWMINFLKAYGYPIPKHDDFTEQRKLLLKSAHALAEQKNLSGVYEVILLDEAQDYWVEEIQLFARLAKRLFIVADGRQQIYAHNDSIKLAKSIASDTKVLKHHFRNGVKVCRLADNIGKSLPEYVSMEATSHYDEQARPSSVEKHHTQDFDGQALKILEKIDVQLKAYPDELIGICCPRRKDVDTLWKAIQESAHADVATVQNDDGNCEFGPTTRICVCTIHAAKGLEFRALHLAGLEALERFTLSINLAFTAVTRAKTSLSMYYSSDLVTFLDDALQKLEPPPPLPVISSVFGKAK